MRSPTEEERRDFESFLEKNGVRQSELSFANAILTCLITNTDNVGPEHSESVLFNRRKIILGLVRTWYASRK